MDRRPIGYDYGLCFPGTTTSVELAQQISARFITKDEELPPMFNYYSRVMMNLPLEVEGAPVDIDVKILDDLFWI